MTLFGLLKGYVIIPPNKPHQTENNDTTNKPLKKLRWADAI